MIIWVKNDNDNLSVMISIEPNIPTFAKQQKENKMQLKGRRKVFIIYHPSLLLYCGIWMSWIIITNIICKICITTESVESYTLSSPSLLKM